MILNEILANKKKEVQSARQRVSLAVMRAQAADAPPVLDFATALGKSGVSLIAEVKKASPSKGVISHDLDPVKLALSYATHGATAISVLTDERFFQGDIQTLTAIRATLRKAVPLLRKDFIIDPYQVYETRAAGADALLLIVAALSDDELTDLLGLTHGLGMTALVEVHEKSEIHRVLPLKPRVMGINNRNLKDFTVDLSGFERLRALIPEDVIVVAESGIQTAADVRRLAKMGADAVLVGETLVRAEELGKKIHELIMGGLP